MKESNIRKLNNTGEKIEMANQYKKQMVLMFLEYANEATAKISEINKLVCGMEMPEDESLLGAIYNNVYFDKLNNMAVELMHAKKDEIGEIIKEYSDIII